MGFAAPLNLLVALVVPALLALAWLERRRAHRYAIRHPGVGVLGAAVAAAPRWRRRLPGALIALAALALALAFARPERTVAVPVEQASVVLVTDGSGSMAATDVRPTRLEAARSAAHSFLDRVPKSLLVGFVGYSTVPFLMEPPTKDHERIRAALDSLPADGATATGDALTAALDRLEARRDREGRVAPAAIILLSDGKTTEGSDPVDAARRAGRLRIPIHTVALGTPDGVLRRGLFGADLPVPPDPETLRAIARSSGGSAFEVADAERLDGVYEDLGSRLGTRPVRREVAAPFAGVGLALLAAGVAAGMRRRPRIA